MPTAALHRLPAMTPPLRAGSTLDYCGPARVTAVLGRDVELEMPDDARRWARLAIAIAYQPVAGDIVLMLATDQATYVVGVLEGQGPSVLNAPGDLELNAPDGEIRINAAKACVVAAPQMRVQAASIDLIGDTLHEAFETVRRRVTGSIDTRARALTTTVTETWRLVARRITGRGQENVTIDSPSINLG